ncbi:MAG: diguanylate cyclase [candidate division Zixibacteria bacterium]|nr:diguanylate cyclase [candidate division Zixibacteria bacterium]
MFFTEASFFLLVALIILFIILLIFTIVYQKKSRQYYEFMNLFLNSDICFEPQENLRRSFQHLGKMMEADKGILLAIDQGEYVPVALFGFSASGLKTVSGEDLHFENTDERSLCCEKLSGILGWEARSVFPVNAGNGLSAIAVFSAEMDYPGDPLRIKVINSTKQQVAFALEYVALKLSYRTLRKKFTAQFNEIVNLKREIRRKVYDINSLFKESSNLYTILNEEKLFNSFLLMIVGQLGLHRAAILHKEQDGDEYKLKHHRGLSRDSIGLIRIRNDSTLITYLNSLEGPMMLDKVCEMIGENPDLTTLRTPGFRIIYRLTFRGTTFGYLLTGDKVNGNQYLSSDLKLMTILVNMLTSALENTTNYNIIEELSFTDSLTGLYNYRYFYKRLNEEIFRAKRYFRSLALVIFDIDNFKLFNDTYGHQAGDAVLRQLGAFVQKLVRSIDVVCRYGGEEFCVIMQETGANDAIVFVERLREKVESFKFSFDFAEEAPGITVSIGVAIYPLDAQNADKLIYSADMALLQAKSDGKNRYRLYSELHQPIQNDTNIPSVHKQRIS